MGDFGWVIVGVLGLWIGTEVAVRAGAEIGRRLGLSEMFLGLTVFAIGTDLSELLVAIEGATRLRGGAEASGIVVGNALGSVLAQGAMVLGVITLFDRSVPTASVTAERNPLWDASAWLAAVALLGIAAIDGEISRIEGAALCVAYLAYLGILIRMSHAVEKLRAKSSPIRFLLPIGAVVVGLVVVAFSADLAVEHGLGLATRYELDPTAIGLFGIGVGTSLPELAVSIGAAARGRPALSLGNVIGSNTFDLLVPMGAGALIHPLTVERNSLYFDLPAITILAIYFAFRLATRGHLDTRDALGLFGFYVTFALFRLGTFVG